MSMDAKQHNHSTSLFLLLGVVALLWFTTNVHGAEVTPTQPTESSPIGQNFDPLDPNNQLVQDNLNKKQLNKAQQKKGWLDWLTDISRKPANFHYIDFIELFH